MLDRQRMQGAREHRQVRRLVAAGALVAIGTLVLGGCVGAGSSSRAPLATGIPGSPPAVAPGPESAVPAPGASGAALVGLVPCPSSSPGPQCGDESAAPSSPTGVVPPPASVPPVFTVPASEPPASAAPPHLPPPVPAGTPIASTSSPTPTPVAPPAAPAGSEVVVTMADDGTTLQLTVGQRFLLDLGSDLEWAVSVADEEVVQRVPGVLVIRGAQGIYEARATGTTVLTAVGSAACSSGACPLFRLGFHVTIVVG